MPVALMAAQPECGVRSARDAAGSTLNFCPLPAPRSPPGLGTKLDSALTPAMARALLAAAALSALAATAAGNPSSRHLPPPRPFSHEDRHQHHLNGAGLRADGVTSTAGDPADFNKRFPTDVPGIFFSGVFTNHTVLQRAPETSAVYGVVVGGAKNVEVAMSGTSESGELEDVAGIAATVDSSTTAQFGYARWKAVLPAHAAGGSFTMTASCTGCGANHTSTAISDVTFGEVWFCSGQSNMVRPMLRPLLSPLPASLLPAMPALPPVLPCTIIINPALTMFWALPSDVPPARETMPKGNSADVADEPLQTSRQVSIRFFILHASGR
eukprot:SAG22_NODE_2529_length_2473_cov_3.477675_4_plen_326_part_00